MERGESKASEEKPEGSLIKILEKVQETERFKMEIGGWKLKRAQYLTILSRLYP